MPPRRHAPQMQGLLYHLHASLALGAAGLAAATSDEESVNPLRPAKPALTQEVQARSYFSRVMQNTTDLLVFELGSLTDIGVVLVLLAFTVLTIYIVPAVVDDALARFRTPGHVRTITKTVLQLAIAYAGLRLALGAVGVGIDSIVASLSLVTVAISIGAAAAISNAAAGLCRTSEELQPGHRIVIHEYVGVVEELGFFNVRLRSESTGRLVVIPNSDFLQSCWEYAPPATTPTFEPDPQLEAKNLNALKNKNR